MPKNSGNFSKENQPETRRGRSKSKKTLMLDAIREEVTGGEHEFLRKVVRTAIGDENTEANHQLLTLVLNRIEPPIKATLPYIEFDFDPSLKPHEQAAQVMDAVASGDVTPDIGAMFVSSVKSMLDIEEHTDLKDRIEKLEAILNNEPS